MAGTLMGVANTQQHDINGQPLTNCILTIYQGGTTTPASVFQDIGLIIPAPNPLVADATGRLPLFFLSDGTYAARLTDKNGVQSNGGFFYPQIPSIGASSSGGGGTPVDPTTVASTGDWKWRPSAETLAGWVRLNARTIGNASSGASERANADTQALYVYIWTIYSQPTANVVCPVVGGIGASALADFNANKQITLKDMRGRAPFGLDDMGNAALGAFTGVAFTQGNATTGGAAGGTNSTTLTLPQLPTGITSANAAQAITINFGLQIPATALGAITGTIQPSPGGTDNVPKANASFGSISSVTTSNGISVTSSNTGGQAFPSVPSAMLGTHFWKL